MINSPTRQTTPRTILVVEDEPTLATAIAQRITAEGWSARVASDGASAVQAAKHAFSLSFPPVYIAFSSNLAVLCSNRSLAVIYNRVSAACKPCNADVLIYYFITDDFGISRQLQIILSFIYGAVNIFLNTVKA